MLYQRLFRIGLLFPVCLGCLLFVDIQPVQAQAIRQVTDFKGDYSGTSGIDDAGTIIVGASCSDPFGTNPDHAWQIIKWELPGGTRSQLTDFPGGVGYGTGASITDDGQVIAFSAAADPFGQNHDLGRELFLMQSDGTGLIQLTDDAILGGGEAYYPAISGSGNRIVFQTLADGHDNLLRRRLAVGQIKILEAYYFQIDRGSLEFVALCE